MCDTASHSQFVGIGVIFPVDSDVFPGDLSVGYQRELGWGISRTQPHRAGGAAFVGDRYVVRPWG